MYKKLNFKDHITSYSKEKKRDGLPTSKLQILQKYSNTIKILYYALVWSHMETGSLVWDPVLKKHSEAIEKIQCRFLKYIYLWVFQYYPVDVSYKKLLKGFEMESLENWRRNAQLNFLHSVYCMDRQTPAYSRKLNCVYRGQTQGYRKHFSRQWT